jgi:OOP family OmpA-OmpF porin
MSLAHSIARTALFALLAAGCAASPRRAVPPLFARQTLAPSAQALTASVPQTMTASAQESIAAPAPQTITVLIRQKPPAPVISLRDTDGDGVPDIDDGCPDVFGSKETQGCPAETPKLVQVREDRIEVKQPLHFKPNRAVLLTDSLPVLQEVANALKQARAVRVRVEGHTDRVGERDENLKLSQARADAVREYLVTQGVEATRLSAEGFGWSRPIASNITKEGRSQNRRVEFRILE